MSLFPLPGTIPPVANLCTIPPLFKVADGPPAPGIFLIVSLLLLIDVFNTLILETKLDIVLVNILRALVLVVIASTALDVKSVFSLFLSLFPVIDDPKFSPAALDPPPRENALANPPANCVTALNPLTAPIIASNGNIGLKALAKLIRPLVNPVIILKNALNVEL